MIQKKYDVIVIGAGSGGLTSAVGFVNAGRTVLLIEKEHMGGECTNSGCVPSKALLHHAKTFYSAKKIAGESDNLETYRTEALGYVRGKVASFLQHERPEDFEKMGIDVVMGEAEFLDRCVVRVGEHTYQFKTAVVASGSSPRTIHVDGLQEEDVLTNQNIFQLEEIPKKLTILGSGPIGMELGQAFAMLGSAVTIISRDDRFALLEDPKISALIKKEFEDLGITILLKSGLKKVDNKCAVVAVEERDGVKKELQVPFDALLVAIGRVPQFPKGLTEAGIEHDEHAIATDSQYRTSNKDVYAVGDVALRMKFTHTADDAARQVVTHVASKKLLRVNKKKAVPKVTYTAPPISAVGLSYEAACKKYDCSEIMALEVPYTLNDRAKTDSATNGLMILTVRRLNGAVLGANIIGTAAGELISIFTLAIDQKISMWKLHSSIYAYPTYSLLIKKAGDLFVAESVTNLKRDVLALLKKHVPKIVAIAFWVTILYFFHQYRSTNGLSNKAMLSMLYEFVTTTTWGPIVYMSVYALRPIIFFPATLLTALSGILFGLPLGILYTVIGENASANLAYWIGRFFGKELNPEDSFIGGWVEALRKRPFMSVLFMRLFYVPFDLTNYGSGILRVRWVSYTLATLVGIMPGLVTFVALGAGIKDISTFDLTPASFDFVSLGIAVGVFAVSLTLSRYLKGWHAEREV